jgi:hypothetical protein
MQVARPVGRRQASHPVPRDANLLIIAPAFADLPPVMDIGTYMRAWMILDNYPWAEVYAFHGDHLARVEMGRPRSSKMYGSNAWWTRDLHFVPFTRGPFA